MEEMKSAAARLLAPDFDPEARPDYGALESAWVSRALAGVEAPDVGALMAAVWAGVWAGMGKSLSELSLALEALEAAKPPPEGKERVLRLWRSDGGLEPWLTCKSKHEGPCWLCAVGERKNGGGGQATAWLATAHSPLFGPMEAGADRAWQGLCWKGLGLAESIDPSLPGMPEQFLWKKRFELTLDGGRGFKGAGEALLRAFEPVERTESIRMAAAKVERSEIEAAGATRSEAAGRSSGPRI